MKGDIAVFTQHQLSNCGFRHVVYDILISLSAADVRDPAATLLVFEK